MLSDDQSWSGLSVEMHPEVAASKNDQFRTPWLKKMASEGMRFSAAYAPSPVCSPTRASLQTGKSPAQLNWTKAAPVMTASDGYKMISPVISKSLNPEEVTIAELLQTAGYATAHYGKWHLRGGGPGEHGYDEHDGDIGNEYASKFAGDNPVDIVGMAKRAGMFMRKNVQAGKPFFIQMSLHALHYLENARKETVAKYSNFSQGKKGGGANMAAITEDLDSGVGMVLQALEWLKVANNTYVIYMSDNGGGVKRGALRGGKGSLMEGGVRVPMIVKGPGVSANSWCYENVVGYDWFPTFCDWAGVQMNKRPLKLEGGSLVSLLQNGGQG